MGKNMVETVMGGVVLLVAAIFLVFFARTAEIKSVTGYEIHAKFYKIGGLQDGSDVRISGIKVGTVTGHRLDPETFDAVVTMSISPSVKLPTDTVAAIASEGLLGGKYVRLKPGRTPESLEVGGTITKTEDFRSLEDQVGEIIFLATSGPDEGRGTGGGLGGGLRQP
jgi:phospholipid/cholesterol/gamma-HCH transport system substrate-binding protein